MKYIVKQQEPQSFADWKALANVNWHPAYASLDGDTRKAVKDALMTEQGYLCCYCERRLTPDDSHIEHFRPQSDQSVNPLDFSNMLCSCQNRLSKGEPRHCGHLKGDRGNDECLISPLDPLCEARFSFTGDGHINSADTSDTGAIETIKRLGLDIPKLTALRAKVIEPFLEDGLAGNEIKQFVSGYLQKDSQGAYGEFWTTIQYLFGDYVPV